MTSPVAGDNCSPARKCPAAIWRFSQPGVAAQVRQSIRAARSQAGPGFLDCSAAQRREQSTGERDQSGNAVRGGPGVEAGVFFGRAGEEFAIAARHEVAFALEQERANAWAVGVEQYDLPAHGADARRQTEVQQQRPCPARRRPEGPARQAAVRVRP